MQLNLCVPPSEEASRRVDKMSQKNSAQTKV
jgi:hypothetical protein